jgi:CxxC-x17-CxxC domain-containing protein
MGRFNSDNRGRSRDRDSGRSGGFGGRSGGYSGGRSSGGRSRFGSRDSGRSEMHDVTCDKCGKDCQVPFKPTGEKPVLCSDCFRKNDSGSRNSNESSQGRGMSIQQFNLLNSKLDKILEVLNDLEIVVDDGSEGDLEEGEEESEEEDLDEDADDDSEEEEEGSD